MLSLPVKFNTDGGFRCRSIRWLHIRKKTQTNILSEGRAAVGVNLQFWRAGRMNGRGTQEGRLTVLHGGWGQKVRRAALKRRVEL